MSTKTLCMWKWTHIFTAIHNKIILYLASFWQNKSHAAEVAHKSSSLLQHTISRAPYTCQRIRRRKRGLVRLEIPKATSYLMTCFITCCYKQWHKLWGRVAHKFSRNLWGFGGLDILYTYPHMLLSLFDVSMISNELVYMVGGCGLSGHHRVHVRYAQCHYTLIEAFTFGLCKQLQISRFSQAISANISWRYKSKFGVYVGTINSYQHIKC